MPTDDLRRCCVRRFRTFLSRCCCSSISVGLPQNDASHCAQGPAQTPCAEPQAVILSLRFDCPTTRSLGVEYHVCELQLLPADCVPLLVPIQSSSPPSLPSRRDVFEPTKALSLIPPISASYRFKLLCLALLVAAVAVIR